MRDRHSSIISHRPGTTPRPAALVAGGALAWVALLLAAAPAAAQAKRFVCGAEAAGGGAVRIGPGTVYTPARGYGFHQAIEGASGGACGSDAPFLFSVDLPEGDYDVAVTFGDGARASESTVKAESRRLMLEEVSTAPGEVVTRSFTVNVHRYRIAGGDSVRRKPREIGSYSWDDRLTLEFNGRHPAVRAISIRPADHPITVFLAGNSTVVDQAEEPWAAWGQMFPRFFQPGDVVIANYAESGETLKAFVGEKRLAKVLSVMEPGDYLFIEFAHNDQKPGPSHVDAFTSYKEYLKRFIGEARRRGANPVLVTSTQRRNFDASGKVVNTLGDYPEAMRQTAAEEHVPLVDLTRMTERFYEAMGPEASARAFVHYPANTFPGQRAELKDDTHFNNYGAYEIAKMVVEGIRADDLLLARHLLPGLPRFDPSHPDPVASFDLPRSPFSSAARPAGS
jgi:lysophospholipase L1-like esterase